MEPIIYLFINKYDNYVTNCARCMKFDLCTVFFCVFTLIACHLIVYCSNGE